MNGRESFTRQADLFAALLDALDLPQVAVVTLSSGGPPGYLLAARHPDRVSAVVAISSVSGHYASPHTAGPVAQALFTSRIGEFLTRTMARRAPRQLVTQLLRAESHLTPEQVRTQVDHVLRARQVWAWLRAFIDTLHPYRPRRPGTDNDTVQLGQITDLPLADARCSTLVVHGTHDADVPLEHGAHAHDQIPGAEYRWIESGSHLGFWLAPHAEPVRAAAREFLDRRCRPRTDHRDTLRIATDVLVGIRPSQRTIRTGETDTVPPGRGESRAVANGFHQRSGVGVTDDERVGVLPQATVEHIGVSRIQCVPFRESPAA